MKLKRYLINLWRALIGKNPYSAEFENEQRLRMDSEAQARHYADLAKKAAVSLAGKEQDVKNYQNLTENLRQRITEKDVALEDASREVRDANERMNEQKMRYKNAINTMRKQHKVRVGELEAEVAQLREGRDYALDRLQEAKQEQAREVMANARIERTNGWLDDLYAALVSGDIEKLAEIGERDELDSRFSRIVQQCVAILIRKWDI